LSGSLGVAAVDFREPFDRNLLVERLVMLIFNQQRSIEKPNNSIA
jgi:hypothetical protein